MTSGIYRIDLGNGWFYIGSAANLKRRETEHRRTLKRKTHCNQRMQNCFNKYGVIEFTILEHCVVKKLIVREQTYLDKHFDDPKNVNLAPTAGSCLGRRHSAETRAKMSATSKGKPKSAEARAKMSVAWKSRLPASAETRAKISATSKGRIHSDETRAKISAAKKGTVFSAEHRAKISATSKGRVVSAETRAKLVAASKDRKPSAETRAKMSAATKAYYVRKAQAA